MTPDIYHDDKLSSRGVLVHPSVLSFMGVFYIVTAIHILADSSIDAMGVSLKPRAGEGLEAGHLLSGPSWWDP